jgi:hypothetical protein
VKGSDYTDKDIEYIKKMFCKFNCTANNTQVDVEARDDCVECPECENTFSSMFFAEVDLTKEHCCEFCQLDNFIQELYNNKII